MNKFDMPKLPREFAILRRRKAKLKRELARIEALEANLIETRELMRRAMMFIGSFSEGEFDNSQGETYMKLFLQGKLELAASEAMKKD